MPLNQNHRLRHTFRQLCRLQAQLQPALNVRCRQYIFFCLYTWLHKFKRELNISRILRSLVSGRARTYTFGSRLFLSRRWSRCAFFAFFHQNMIIIPYILHCHLLPPAPDLYYHRFYSLIMSSIIHYERFCSLPISLHCPSAT